MINKLILALMIFVLCLSAVSAVSASENVTDDLSFNEIDTGSNQLGIGIDDCSLSDSSKKNTTIEAHCDDIYEGETATVNVVLAPDAEGVVLVDVSGMKLYGDVENGTSNVKVSGLDAGIFNADILYCGDSRYNSISTALNITVLKKPSGNLTSPNMTVDAPSEIDLEKSAVVSVSLASDAKGEIIVLVDARQYSSILPAKGIAVVSIENLTSGNHNVEVRFKGDEKYLSQSESFTLKVNKLTPAVYANPIEISEGDTANLTVILPSDAGGVVLADVNGLKYYKEVSKNQTIFSIESLKSGEYIANITYMGDAKYESCALSTAIKVKSPQKEENLTAVEMNVTLPESIDIGMSAHLQVKLPADAAGKVDVFVDGRKHSSNVASRGSVSISLDNLTVGAHAVEVKFAGDEKYLPAFKNASITVNKLKSAIYANPVRITEGETANVTVILSADATGVVLAEVGEMRVYANIVERKAQISIPSLTAGEFDVKLTYPGDRRYASSNTTVTVRVNEVKKVTPKMDLNVSSIKNTAQIFLEIPEDASASVEFFMDGVSIKNMTLADGKANFVLNDLEKGSHLIEARYPGDAKYSNSTASAVVVIEGGLQTIIPTYIEVASSFKRVANDYNAGERGAMFYAVLKDEKGNPLSDKTVQIALNGPIYNVTTDKDGRAGLQVNLANANTYTYALSFLGDEKYGTAKLASTKLTITKKTTSISASNKIFKKKLKSKVVKVTLKTVKNPYDGKTYLKSGKKLTLTIGSKTYSGKINSKGVVKFKIKLTKKGKYSATVKFDGDNTYSGSSKKIKITVK